MESLLQDVRYGLRTILRSVIDYGFRQWINRGGDGPFSLPEGTGDGPSPPRPV